MIDKPPPLKGLNIRIPVLIPIKGRGVINYGSTLYRVWGRTKNQQWNMKWKLGLHRGLQARLSHVKVNLRYPIHVHLPGI